MRRSCANGCKRIALLAASSEDIAAVRTVLRRIPALAPVAGEARIAPLGGRTNRAFRVDTGAEAYCLRLPGLGTAGLVNRENEAANGRIAAAAGVAPELVYAGSDGVIVTHFIENAVALSPEGLSGDDTAARVGELLRHFHDRAPPFRNRFLLSGYFRRYCSLIETAHPGVLASLDLDLAAAEVAARGLEASSTVLRPCHCDLQPSNILDAGARLWLIDWEFSGQNDPFWDLGYLSLEAGLRPESDEQLVAAYLQRPATDAELSRVAVYKVLADLLAVLWHLLLPGSGPDLDSEGEVRAARYRAATDSPGFREQLGRLSSG